MNIQNIDTFDIVSAVSRKLAHFWLPDLAKKSSTRRIPML
jgi:hypothetical protein